MTYRAGIDVRIATIADWAALRAWLAERVGEPTQPTAYIGCRDGAVCEVERYDDGTMGVHVWHQNEDGGWWCDGDAGLSLSFDEARELIAAIAQVLP